MSAPKPSELVPSIENRKNRAWREVAAIDAALERGEIDAAGWHRAMASIFAGNAIDWRTARRFTFVRTGLEYVPIPHRPQLVRHLLANVVEPGGRLIVGTFTEEAESRSTEEDVASWGFLVRGRHEVPYPDDPRLACRVFWLDQPARRTAGQVRRGRGK